MNPLVSVVIPTHNRGQYLSEAIKSVLGQTYKNIELVIVDDGSTDTTKAIIESYVTDERIVYLYQEYAGVSRARNTGTRVSRGNYIAVLDSDDVWCDKDKLRKQVNFLEQNKECVLVGGGVIRVSGLKKELARILLPQTDEEIRKLILFNNLFANSTVMFRRDIWEKVGGYNEALSFAEDWDLWLKMGRLGKYYNFKEYFVCYLQEEQNMSNFNMVSHVKTILTIKKRYRHDYVNFWRAYIWGCLCGGYYFAPFKKWLQPLALKARKRVVGY